MDPIEAHREEAPEYDRQAREWGCNPEVVFGMMWEYVQPGDSLLDIGIGTGLCSQAFRKAGLKIYGFDGADEMLEICRSKNIAEDLKVHDITDRPWPYADNTFNHVLTAGVFYFFGDLRPIFDEVSRIIEDGGTYGFLVSRLTPQEVRRFKLDKETGFAKIHDDASGVKIYKHSQSYIESIAKETGFSIKKELIFLAFVNPDTNKEHYGKLYVAQKTD